MDKLSLVKEFSRELTSTIELDRLARVVNDFFVMKIGAEHSSISLEEGGKYSYGSTREKIFDDIEPEIFKYIMNVGKMLRISSPKEEYMLKQVKGIGMFRHSILAFPLITKNSALGSLNLYFSKIPDDGIIELITLFAELSASSIMNSISYKALEATSATDKLTGLCNRRSFDREIDKTIMECSASKTPVSLMMVDIDKFKDYNDMRGHKEGDRALADIGKCIAGLPIKNGKAFRYGGEEFAVIVQKESPEKALESAELLRKGIEKVSGMTVSIGLATCMNSSCPSSMMVGEADKMLYKAKKSGRNKTCSAVIIDRSISPIDVEDASGMGAAR